MTAAWKTWAAPTPDADLWEWQAGRCAWCGRNVGDVLWLDHCHMTGLVRGYLCRSCNRVEGSGENGEWDEWRNGDHTATAIGHVDWYVNQRGETAISQRSALYFYSRTERQNWWRSLVAAHEAGEFVWPLDAPLTDMARTRRDHFREQTRAAVASLGSISGAS